MNWFRSFGAGIGNVAVLVLVLAGVLNFGVALGSEQNASSKPSPNKACEGAATAAPRTSAPSAMQIWFNKWYQVKFGQLEAMQNLIIAGVIEGGSIIAVTGSEKERILAEFSSSVLVTAVDPGLTHTDLRDARIRVDSSETDSGHRRGYIQIGKHIYEVRVPESVNALVVKASIAATPATSPYRAIPSKGLASAASPGLPTGPSTVRPVEGIHALMRRLLVDSGKMTEAEFSRIDSRSMEMIEVSPGTFMMGSPSNEPGRYDNETQHQVTITKPYQMLKTPATQALALALGENPSRFVEPDSDGDHAVIGGIKINLNHPVESLDENTINRIFKKLNENDPDYEWRQATEAEYEYAMRAGTTTAYPWGNDGSQATLDNHSWNEHNSERRTHAVGQKPANAWGFLDMTGNIWVRVRDWFDNFTSEPQIDPTGPKTGHSRVIRGGSWNNDAQNLRSAFRYYDHPDNRYGNVGLRPVRTPRERSSR